MLDLKSRLMWFWVVALCAGCGATGGSAARDPGSAVAAGPTLHDVTPNSVRAGEDYPVVLTIQGEGFDPERNIIRLGNVLTDTVPFATGTTIRWDMPKTVRSASEVPSMVIQAGRYALTVETSEGVSNSVIVTLLAER